MARILSSDRAVLVLNGDVRTAKDLCSLLEDVLTSSGRPLFDHFKAEILPRCQQVWDDDAERERKLEARPMCTGCGRHKAGWRSRISGNPYCDNCLDEEGVDPETIERVDDL